MGEALFKPEPKEKYSYADYKTWPDDFRCELIDGVIYEMSPASSFNHQKIVGKIFVSVSNFLEGKPCTPFVAPLDVRFIAISETPDENVYTTVQPDVGVICDKTKITELYCEGPPDLVVEVLSPSTGFKDQTQKLELYEKYGVREFWVVNPEVKYIMIYNHNGKDFNKPEYLKGEDLVKSRVLEGFEVPLLDIFS